jgi:toxin-antitoxin system PIN domain toxin
VATAPDRRAVIAVDTNVLVYAHRPEMGEHEAARAALRRLTQESAWGLPWPVAHEFVRVVTEPRSFIDPTPLERALATIAALLQAPGCRPLGEGPGHWKRLTEIALAGRAGQAMLYDARIAAICLAHGVNELWTADRDFGRFPGLRTRNPMVSRIPPLG